MKVARTFTIDLTVASELKEVKNQSAFVNAAVKSRLQALSDQTPLVVVATYECTVCNRTKKARAGDKFVFCHDCGMNGDGSMKEIKR